MFAAKANVFAKKVSICMSKCILALLSIILDDYS